MSFLAHGLDRLVTPLVIFDLDGTLADDSHRSHLLRENPKRWNEYFALCHLDAPKPEVVELAKTLSETYSVVIWSGRSESVRSPTLQWAAVHLADVFVDEIRLRPVEDRTDDNELKRRWLAEHRAAGGQVLCVFEDRARVVEMWRAEGVLCCQVAKGDF